MAKFSTGNSGCGEPKGRMVGLLLQKRPVLNLWVQDFEMPMRSSEAAKRSPSFSFDEVADVANAFLGLDQVRPVTLGVSRCQQDAGKKNWKSQVQRLKTRFKEVTSG